MIKLPKVLCGTSLASLLAVFATAPIARADIFQWEYINPANPTLGKQQSTTLCESGTGVVAVPSVSLSNRNLTMAYMIGADLTGAYATSTNLTNADLSQANLTNSRFDFATMTGANLAGAEVRGAVFTEITAAQLYSTSSYQAKDLTGINLFGNQSGWNFAGQNLTNASFPFADLTNAEFSQANLSNANFPYADLTDANLNHATLSHAILSQNNLTRTNLSQANLTSADLGGATLTNAKLNQANLTNADFNGATLGGANLAGADARGANFQYATLTGANLTEADVRGATFYSDILNYVGVTPAQLYSTASYQAKDLTGISLSHTYLGGANLGGQNLTNADFSYSVLVNTNLSQANLTNAKLSAAALTGANLTGADVRGAHLDSTTEHGFTAAQLYSTASYQNHDLTGINLYFNNLAGWNFAGQNLTNASFAIATLTGANFSGAEVRGANFNRDAYPNANSGITVDQLYSTASYQAHDLAGIKLDGNNLAGGSLNGQNLTNASFIDANMIGANLTQANLTGAVFDRTNFTNANLSQCDLSGLDFASSALTGANLTGADVRRANFSWTTGFTAAQLYSTASFQNHDLTGISLGGSNLTGANLANQNLTNANFYSTTLTGANLTEAEVRGATFSSITAAQLYSTASYQAHDLTGIGLFDNFAGINLAGQNLTNAYLSAANLTNANLSQANLTNAYFAGFTYPIYDENGEYAGEEVAPGANLTGATISGADARGAQFQYATLTGMNTTNLIQSNGHIAGLVLTGGKSLVVRDYDGNPAAASPTGPLPIVVEEHLAMNATGTLRLVFDADPWNSTISFAPGIPVVRGGALELTFGSDVNVASQLGRTIDLFDWTGVNPTGAFNVSSPYSWNLSNLYTTGEVTLISVPGIVPGDFNGNGTVNASDYVAWRKNDGTQAGYDTWRSHFDQPPGSSAGIIANAPVPEPTTFLLLMFAAAGGCLRRSRLA